MAASTDWTVSILKRGHTNYNVYIQIRDTENRLIGSVRLRKEKHARVERRMA